MTDENKVCKNCGKEIYQHKGVWFHHGMVTQCTFEAEPKEDCKSSTLQMNPSADKRIWTTSEILNEWNGLTISFNESVIRENMVKEEINLFENKKWISLEKFESYKERAKQVIQSQLNVREDAIKEMNKLREQLKQKDKELEAELLEKCEAVKSCAKLEMTLKQKDEQIVAVKEFCKKEMCDEIDQSQEIHENYCALKERFAKMERQFKSALEDMDLAGNGILLLLKEVKELKEQLKQADEILLDVLIQSCGSDCYFKDCDNPEDVIDNQCLSAYEDACSYLAKKNLLINVNGRIYKIVGKEE